MRHLALTLIILIGELLAEPAASQSARTNKPLGSVRARSGPATSVGALQELLLKASSQVSPDSGQLQYKCAKYCSCSTIQLVDRSNKLDIKLTNYTQAKCESSSFSDILTIDRRTQIIQISLPNESQQEDNPKQANFRMPRLVQFGNLREILVINLKFQVCDSEVFKRGQKLMRLLLNHNQLARLSKACFRHLDKLTDLNLDFNQLEELESALFNSLLNLRHLSIAHNRLSDLAAHQFANLTRLQSLNLLGNSFKTINLHLLEPMQATLRLLVLAQNEIKSFTYAPPPGSVQQNSQTGNNNSTRSSLMGIAFKSLAKLNVDQNKFERIKLLQLHRFFNIKFLSIRQNQIATIRDKAFNGLRLFELNLAQNQLQSISKCAFCNSTIRRLVLAQNNISVAQPASVSLSAGGGLLDQTGSAPQPLLLMAPQEPNSGGGGAGNPEAQAQTYDQSASSSQNTLILSQSIFGPLFNKLEYLDLSRNEFIADSLELLLEPLLQLEYLNLAGVGLDRSLPTPNLFKNNRKLRYVNLSHNGLDLLVSETVEPLGSLEVLDLSHNKFTEMDESFIVTLDEVTALYDWILRSPIYNATCIGAKTPPEIATDDSVSGETPPEVDRSSPVGYKLTDMKDHSMLSDWEQPLESVGFEKSLASSLDVIANGNSYAIEESPESLQKLASELAQQLAIEQDDRSIPDTLGTLSMSSYEPGEFCMRCEFPGELRAYEIHELSPSDFKFCAGSAPRLGASEPKIGLTLGLVIIGALIVVILVIIVLYRKKHNTYYPNDESTDRLNEATGGKKTLFSVSSDAENGYNGDATDYSSPPMSQSIESYSQEDEEDEELEFEDEDEEELDEEDEEDEEIEDIDEEEEEETTGNSQSNNVRRMAEAEQERHRQLAEYNLRDVADKSSPGGSSSQQRSASPIQVVPLPAAAPTRRVRQNSSQSKTNTQADSRVHSLAENSTPPPPPEVIQALNRTSSREVSVASSAAELEVRPTSISQAEDDNKSTISRMKVGQRTEEAGGVLPVAPKQVKSASRTDEISPPLVVDRQAAQTKAIPAKSKPTGKQSQQRMRQQSSLQSVVSSQASGNTSRRSVVKSSQTVDTPSLRRPQSSAAPAAVAAAVALKQSEQPRRAALGRQKFASSSKEPSWQTQQQQQQQLVREEPQVVSGPRAEPAERPAELEQAEYDYDEVELILAAAELEAASESEPDAVNLGPQTPPTMSDATTADSIANLEVVEYASNSDIDDEQLANPSPVGGALADQTATPEPPEVGRRYLSSGRRPAGNGGGAGAGDRLSGRSSHSALTQTSTHSRDD